MKKNYYDHGSRIAAIEEKCDIIIELLESVLDSPDFLIDRLRKAVEEQHRAAVRKPRMEIVRCHES